jgi:hypothetical protein
MRRGARFVVVALVVGALVVVSAVGLGCGAFGSASSPTDAGPDATEDAGDAGSTDPSDPRGDADVADASILGDGGRWVFVTSEAATGAFGGLPGGNQHCFILAQDAGIDRGRAWRAFLRGQDITSGEDPDRRWYLTNGKVAFMAAPSFDGDGGMPLELIDTDERGAASAAKNAWTGWNGKDCLGWTSDSEGGARRRRRRGTGQPARHPHLDRQRRERLRVPAPPLLLRALRGGRALRLVPLRGLPSVVRLRRLRRTPRGRGPRGLTGDVELEVEDVAEEL